MSLMLRMKELYCLLSAGALRLLRQSWSAAAIACAFILVVALFLVPVPAWMLDFLFVLNIGLSLIVLLRGLLARDSSELFSLPLILLFTTLFRLGLNISSTRLILVHGNDLGLGAAGHVIEAFGTFVVQGDFVVGAIIFSVIALVNFLVIARGSARVAEVSARFSLDALPGRQLAIDADLRSGAIAMEEAERRRTQLGRESQFFGAMDGGMKFVQGDAIACLLIVLLNAIGGVGIGTLRWDMGFTQAVNTYGVLALGDGLVSIVPALLISVCAGIVVTNVSGQREVSAAGMPQIFFDSRALFLTGGAITLLALLPGFRLVPVFLVGALLILLALRRSSATEGGAEEERSGESPDGGPFPILLEVSEELWSEYLAGAEIPPVRSYSEERCGELFRERGVWLPDVVLRSNDTLSSGSYQVLIRGELVREGIVNPDQVLVPLAPLNLAAFALKGSGAVAHPFDRRLCTWVDANLFSEEAFRSLGVRPILPYQFLVDEALAGALSVVTELFGVDEVRRLLAGVKQHHPQLVDEVIGGGIVRVAEVTEVLQRLTREWVSIRDLKLILEGIARFSCLRSRGEEGGEDRQAWLSDLHAFLRNILSRSILAGALGPGDKMRVFSVPTEVEAEFRSAISLWDRTRGLPPIDPAVETKLRETVSKVMTAMFNRGMEPLVVICAADVRPAVQEVLFQEARGYDCLRVLAYEELGGDYVAEPLGRLAAPA